MCRRRWACSASLSVVVLGNVLAFSLYMSGVPLIGPQKASLYSFAEPVTAAIISTLVLGSPFTLWDALGFGCIFLMLVLLRKAARKTEKLNIAAETVQNTPAQV